MYERIIVPLDGSELAQVALPYAAKLAGRLGSQVTLIYVSESAENQYHHMYQLYLQKICEAIKHDVEKYLEEAGGKATKIESAILVGDPAEEIVDYAEREDIGLIIMSTHGRSGIKRWAMGSVADKVLRATMRPLALIRAKGDCPDMRERDMLNRALVSLDGSKESEAVIPYVGELASKLKTEVILLQVVAPDYHIYTAGRQEYGVYAEQQVESIKASAIRYLDSVGVQLNEKGVIAKSEVRVGTAAEEIIKFADEIYAGLVAMSTHGRSGVGRWALGSVAERVLRSGNAPVLLVRTPGSRTE